MFKALILLFTGVALPVFAVSNAVADLEIINPPLRTGSFDGGLFNDNYEYLTPAGITGEKPPETDFNALSQQVSETQQMVSSTIP